MNTNILEACGLFFNGGSSKISTIGRIAGWSIRLALKAALVVALIGAGQFGQITASAKDIRATTIEEWASLSTSNRTLADLYLRDCVNKGASKRSMDISIESHHECGKNIGADSLVKLLSKNDRVLTTVAWPLSLIAP